MIKKSTKPKAPWTTAFPAQAAALHPKRKRLAKKPIRPPFLTAHNPATAPLIAIFHGIDKNGNSVTFEGVSVTGWKPNRKPLRRRSKRMAKVMAYYRELRDEYLMENSMCMVHSLSGKPHLATDVHHVRGKLETLRIDKRFLLPTCRAGHDFIQSEPDLARESLLLCKKGDWNRAPEDAETRRLREVLKELTK